MYRFSPKMPKKMRKRDIRTKVTQRLVLKEKVKLFGERKRHGTSQKNLWMILNEMAIHQAEDKERSY